MKPSKPRVAGFYFFYILLLKLLIQLFLPIELACCSFASGLPSRQNVFDARKGSFRTWSLFGVEKGIPLTLPNPLSHIQLTRKKTSQKHCSAACSFFSMLICREVFGQKQKGWERLSREGEKKRERTDCFTDTMLQAPREICPRLIPAPCCKYGTRKPPKKEIFCVPQPHQNILAGAQQRMTFRVLGMNWLWGFPKNSNHRMDGCFSGIIPFLRAPTSLEALNRKCDNLPFAFPPWKTCFHCSSPLEKMRTYFQQ